jgi:hypothetical protein
MLKSYAFAASALILAATPSTAATTFGSAMTHEPTPAEQCDSAKPERLCSWVLTQAQGAAGKEKAPKTGTLKAVRIRSCTGGTFILQVARAFPAADQARAVRTRRLINYRGSAQNCNGGRVIETFNVSMPVSTGDYLAVVATEVGFIYNASGDGSHVFAPPLADGGPLRTTTGAGLGNGFLLLQAVYND